MVPLLGGLFAPCDPSRPRAPRGAAGPWCSRTRPTPHGRSRGPRGPECTPHDDRVVLTSPPRPRAGWALEPRAGTGLRKLLALLESRAFPVRSWLCLGDLSKLEVARPATCSTCQKTGGSRGLLTCQSELCRLLLAQPMCAPLLGNAGVQEEKVGVGSSSLSYEWPVAKLLRPCLLCSRHMET